MKTLVESLAEKSIGSLTNITKSLSGTVRENAREKLDKYMRDFSSQVTNSARLANRKILNAIPGLATIAEITGLNGALGTFGSLPFVCSNRKVQTFNNMSIEHGERWAQHDIIGKKPILEHIGPDLKTLTFSMRFDVGLGVDPEACVAKLLRMKDNGLRKALVVGGEYLGHFVIERISEERRHHNGLGNLVVCEVAITAKEVANVVD